MECYVTSLRSYEDLEDRGALIPIGIPQGTFFSPTLKQLHFSYVSASLCVALWLHAVTETGVALFLSVTFFLFFFFNVFPLKKAYLAACLTDVDRERSPGEAETVLEKFGISTHKHFLD